LYGPDPIGVCGFCSALGLAIIPETWPALTAVSTRVLELDGDRAGVHDIYAADVGQLAAAVSVPLWCAAGSPSPPARSGAAVGEVTPVRSFMVSVVCGVS